MPLHQTSKRTHYARNSGCRLLASAGSPHGSAKPFLTDGQALDSALFLRQSCKLFESAQSVDIAAKGAADRWSWLKQNNVLASAVASS
jgi:hypothetical protein